MRNFNPKTAIVKKNFENCLTPFCISRSVHAQPRIARGNTSRRSEQKFIVVDMGLLVDRDEVNVRAVIDVCDLYGRDAEPVSTQAYSNGGRGRRSLSSILHKCILMRSL